MTGKRRDQLIGRAICEVFPKPLTGEFIIGVIALLRRSSRIAIGCQLTSGPIISE